MILALKFQPCSCSKLIIHQLVSADTFCEIWLHVKVVQTCIRTKVINSSHTPLSLYVQHSFRRLNNWQILQTWIFLNLFQKETLQKCLSQNSIISNDPLELIGLGRDYITENYNYRKTALLAVITKNMQFQIIFLLLQ